MLFDNLVVLPRAQYDSVMRYRLRTLMIVLAIWPLVLTLWWLYGRALAILLAMALVAAAIPAMFALWYWMTCKSQAMDPRTRGGDQWNQM